MGRERNGEDSYSTSVNYRGGDEITSPPQPLPAKSPQFISPAMQTEADNEWAELGKIGDAPAYFGNQALAWVKAHPRDSRSAEVLGFAFRAMRNDCNLENRTPLRQQVFNLLHSRYPTSSWAKQYPEFASEMQ
jgi:hypothetical protein